MVFEGRVQHPQQLLKRGVIARLGRCNGLLAQVVAQHIARVAPAHGIALALRLRAMRPKRHPVNTPEAGLVGRSGVLLVEVEGVPGLRVRLGDSDWPARLPRDLRVPEGGQVRVRVEGVDGTTLVVRPE